MWWIIKIAAGFVSIVLLAILGIAALFVAYRMRGKYSASMSNAQSRIDTKLGRVRTNEYVPGGSSIKETLQGYMQYGKWALVAAIVITALVTAAASDLLPPIDWFRHAPSFAQVSEWAWSHWFILILACGGTVIAMRMASAKAVHQYAGVPIGILAFLLVFAPIAASPVGIWVRTQLGVSGYSRPLCADYSPDASHSCNLTEAWSLPIGVDRLTYKDEYFRCVNVPDPKLLEWRTVGVNEIEYRSTRGIIPARYRLESDPSCPVTP